MATKMSASQLRGLLVDDDGREYRQADSILGPSQTKEWGEKLMQGRRDAAIDRFDNPKSISSTGTRIGQNGLPMGFLRPDRMAGGGGQWDAFHGIMAGVKNAAASQGRDMATTGLASRPSMRTLASGTYAPAPQASNDGWEHPDVRAAKLRIVQEQGNAMTDARLQSERELEPGYQDYTRQRDDERDVASFDRRAPIFSRGRELARNADIGDIRARATEQGTNPHLVEERDFQRGMLTDRASMDALARMFGSMRPETAELFENNPGMLDEMGQRVRGGGRGPAAPVGGGPASPEDLPAASPVGGYEGAAAPGQLPPVVRAEIEQMLRQGRYAVNDKNVMAVYQRMQQQPQ